MRIPWGVFGLAVGLTVGGAILFLVWKMLDMIFLLGMLSERLGG